MLAAISRHLSMASPAAAATLAPTHTAAQVGQRIADVPTPALLLDLDALERNVAALEAALAPHAGRVRARPHAKAFKSSALAARLPFERACCQTVREAEAMLLGGIKDVLVTNQVLGPKLPRLAALAAADGATVGALVDAQEHVEALNAAAAEAGVTLQAYVEINGGQNRCGVEGGSDEALSLAQAIIAAPSLAFGGLQCYHGAIQHVRNPAERRESVLSMPVVAARATVERLAAAGIECPIVSGGGTGTFPFELEGGVHNEIQPGSFLFMDSDYNQASAHAAFLASLKPQRVSGCAKSERGLRGPVRAVDLRPRDGHLGQRRGRPAGARRRQQGLRPAQRHASAGRRARHPAARRRARRRDFQQRRRRTRGPQRRPSRPAAPRLGGCTGAEPLRSDSQPALVSAATVGPSHRATSDADRLAANSAFVGVRGGVVESVMPIDARGPGW